MLRIMTNPATQLANLLDSAKGSNTTPVDARGGVHPGDIEFWRSQGQLVQLLRSIDRELEALRSAGIDVQPFETHVTDWYQAVFSFNIPWNTREQHVRPAVDPNALNMLRALAALLGSSNSDREIPLSVAKSLDEALEDALRLLERDRELLSGLEVRYVYSLLDGARSKLQERRIIGEVDLQAKLDQVSGAMVRIGQQLSGTEKAKSEGWFEGAGKIFRVFERGSAFTASAGKAIETMTTIAGELGQ